jgi:hypothetical protein
MQYFFPDIHEFWIFKQTNTLKGKELDALKKQIFTEKLPQITNIAISTFISLTCFLTSLTLLKKNLPQKQVIPVSLAISTICWVILYKKTQNLLKRINFFKYYTDNFRSKFVLKELQKIVQLSKENPLKPCMAILLTQEDSYKDFLSFTALDIYKRCMEHYQIDVITMDKESTNLPDIKKLYDALLVCAHGNQHSITFSSHCILPQSRNDPELQKLTSSVHPAGKILLCSCSTGRGSFNIARELSRYTEKGIQIYAPLLNLTGDNITVTPEGGFFKTNLGIDMTVVYSQGSSFEIQSFFKVIQLMGQICDFLAALKVDLLHHQKTCSDPLPYDLEFIENASEAEIAGILPYIQLHQKISESPFPWNPEQVKSKIADIQLVHDSYLNKLEKIKHLQKQEHYSKITLEEKEFIKKTLGISEINQQTLPLQILLFENSLKMLNNTLVILRVNLDSPFLYLPWIAKIKKNWNEMCDKALS